MRMNIREFKKKYPNLARELLNDEGLGITVSFERKLDDPWRGYLPGPIDYIRRAKDVEEALKVIEYLEKRGEITKDEAEYYREKLIKEGIEAFGPRKEDNYYYKKALEYWRKKYSSGALQQQQS